MKRIQGPLAALFLLALSTPALAQICPASVVTTDANGVALPGIGDGCTTSGLEYLLPHIALFKGDFTPSCNAHDKCVTTLGTTSGSCNSQFYSNMRNACGKYNNWLRPDLYPVYLVCNQAASEYYGAVEIYHNQIAPTAFTGLQYAALNVSRKLGTSVNTDICGTTPEMTTLYSPSLIADVSNAFNSYAGRLPTIYEFLNAVNTGDVVGNKVAWNTSLVQQATAAKGRIPPVITGYTTSDGVSGAYLKVTPVLSGVTYYWNRVAMPGGSTLVASEPKYDTTKSVKGFIKALDSTTGNKNLLIVNTTIRMIGYCSSGPNQPCR